MAAKQTGADLALIDPDGGQLEAAGPAAIDPDDLALETLIEEFEGASSATVKVYRASMERNKPDAFLFECAPADFDLQQIARKWGADTYRVIIYAYVPELGKKVRRANRTMAIELPPGVPDPRYVPMQQPAQANSDEKLIAMFQGITQTMMAGFEKMSATIAAQPKGEGMKDLAGVISILAPILGGGAARSDPLDMLTKVLTIKQQLEGDKVPEGTDPTTAIILKSIDAFAGPVAQMMAAQNAQKGIVNATPAYPSPAPVAALPAPSVPTPDAAATIPAPSVAVPANNPIATSADLSAAPSVENEEMNMRLTLIKAVVLPMAASDANPAPYAEVVLDYFGDDEVAKYIEAPDWQAQLEKLIPEAAQYRPWFEKLRAEVVQLLKGDDQPIAGQ